MLCLSLYQVREVVMGTLSAVQLEDLPVVVKFILHSISASDANEVRLLNWPLFITFFYVLFIIFFALVDNFKSISCRAVIMLMSFHAPQVVCSLRKKLELEQCVLPAVLQASQSRMKSKAMSGWDSIVIYLLSSLPCKPIWLFYSLEDK